MPVIYSYCLQLLACTLSSLHCAASQTLLYSQLLLHTQSCENVRINDWVNVCMAEYGKISGQERTYLRAGRHAGSLFECSGRVEGSPGNLISCAHHTKQMHQHKMGQAGICITCAAGTQQFQKYFSKETNWLEMFGAQSSTCDSHLKGMVGYGLLTWQWVHTLHDDSLD